MRIDEYISVGISPPVLPSPPSASKLFKQFWSSSLLYISYLPRRSKPLQLLYLTMSLQHFPMMAEYNENGSLPIQAISDTQASILDHVLFPGFTRIFTAVIGYLTIDLNPYIP